ncbi:pilus (MSHA type) biogenesis protein MshL [Pelobacter sp. M08fum]|uniref:Pilus (MSHA type) biogenesis protein MshL n=2 Tax=Pelovirga terrestris TaxID=2771352 RepID=A0A8J6QYP8_9BACT|nr:pilus (MSHA type) biogenesis protein MshL [Pelovirga terrestris]MBD1401418.1 pilus (MSHA type) biogenesis protein MshL [Pelovirga terrestris]
MRKRIHQGTISCLCVLLAVGCAPLSRSKVPATAIEEALRVPAVSESVPLPVPPAEVRSALIPPPPVPSRAATVADVERFDINAHQVEARDFFMGLVEGSRTNMVVHPEVKGQISLNLKSTTIDEVMRVVYSVYGYPYSKNDTIYQVMPVGLQSRTFQVNYLNLMRSGSSQTRISSGQVTQGDLSDGGQRSSEGSLSGSRIDTQSLTDFWTELTSAVQGLIGSDDGRKVVVQPQAGLVVVVALPTELRQVDEYLQTVQRNMQRQVVIEAKIIEVTLGDGFQSGINWAALAITDSGKGAFGSQTGGGSVFNQNSSSSGSPIVLQPDGSLPTEMASQMFGGVFGLALNFNNFQGFVELLETQGDVQVLSSPRISTVNNQKAVIKVGSDEFFVTDISSDTTTGTTTNSSTDITLTPFFSGIALDVTPQIDAQGGIILHIHPTVSKVVDQQKQISLFGVNQSLPLAFSTVRESDSIVRADSGQLVVIGGLMQEKTIDDRSGVPLLGRLPGIGGLFRHTRMSSSKSELVILLRPQVIRTAADWQRDIDSSRERVQQMTPQMHHGW